MRRFFELLFEGALRLPALHVRRKLGDEVVDALTAAEILVQNDRAARYPCDSRGDGCPRRVIENILGPATHPWIAVCGRDVPTCADVLLSAEDVREYVVSRERLNHAIRDAIDLGGVLEFLDQGSYGDAVMLGELDDAGGPRDIFACFTTWHGGLEALLLARAVAQRASLVFVPIARAVDPELAHRYTPGAHVSLAFLADLFGIQHGRFVLLRPIEEFTRGRFERSAHEEFCRLYEPGGSRPLSQREYAETIAHPESYDLFLDALVPRAGTRFVGGKKSLDGVYERVEATREQMLVFVELVARGTPAAAAQLDCVRTERIHDPIRMVERARKLLDVNLGHRNRWRSLHITGSASRSRKTFWFRPPEALHYAILAPPRPPRT